ncbi:MAG UNVERIFIED_CONTAM: hypothetical protein LVR18_45830 [Planctomycetaceae bacterium]
MTASKVGPEMMVIFAGAGSDEIKGGEGDDQIDAGDGSNTIYGDAGNDAITAGIGNDTIYGGDGDDVINAGLGDDTIFGELGNDTISFGGGQGTVSGGDGDDSILIGPTWSAGTVTLTGDAGNDVVEMTFNSGSSRINLGENQFQIGNLTVNFDGTLELLTADDAGAQSELRTPAGMNFYGTSLHSTAAGRIVNDDATFVIPTGDLILSSAWAHR